MHGALPQGVLVRRVGQAQRRKPVEQGRQTDLELQASQRLPDALVRSVAEGQVLPRVPVDLEPVGSAKASGSRFAACRAGLFDAIFFGSLERIVNVVPIDATDLADWAVRLYDEYLARPDLIRLATWARLERRPTGHLVADTDRLDAGKLQAIADAQAAGLVRAGDPFDVMAMVIAMSMAWSPVSNVFAATIDEPADVHERRRTFLRDSVQRAVAPGHLES